MTRSVITARQAHLVGLLISATVLAAYTGCGSESARPASGPAPGRAGINVLLVSVDTTRADHVGCYGSAEVRTPNIDRLAAAGVRFAECISPVPLTLPTHATMMTGCDPFVHGARENKYFELAPENVTLAEIFAQAGYQTHAVVAAAVLERRYGLDQGFDTYDEHAPPPESKPSKDAEGSDRIDYLQRPANAVTDLGRQLLTRVAASQEPFFIFLHYFDPHQPHTPPPAFAQRYADPYSAEIAFFDEQFGLLIDRLHELGLAENTLVVLTSDHGEGLGQHGERTHGSFLYDATLHVPLILSCPNLLPAGRTVTSQVRLLDLAPTILAFARLQPGPLTQGVSLLPLIASPNASPGSPAYSETISPTIEHEYSMLRSWRAAGWKYIHAPRPELYHVATDPGETTDLAARDPQRLAALRAALRDYIAAAPASVSTAGLGSIDEAQTRKLAALGYVSAEGAAERYQQFLGGSELDRFEPDGPNPRDHTEEMYLHSAGAGALTLGDYETAERYFRQLLEINPQHAGGLRRFGEALAALDRKDEAITALQRYIELCDDSCEAYWALGTWLIERDDYVEAERALRRGLDCDPDDHRMLTLLGNVLLAQERCDEALECYTAALRLAPDEEFLHYRHGKALRACGRPEGAIVPLRRAVQIRPDHLNAHLQLAGALEDVGDFDGATRAFENLVEVLPDAPIAYDQMARFLDRRQRRAQAVELMRHARRLMPDSDVIATGLAWRLATSPIDELRDGAAAVLIAEQANRLHGEESLGGLETLAAAYAEAGRFEDAIATTQRAIELAQQAGQQELTTVFEQRLEVFRVGKPYRDR